MSTDLNMNIDLSQPEVFAWAAGSEASFEDPNKSENDSFLADEGYSETVLSRTTEYPTSQDSMMIPTSIEKEYYLKENSTGALLTTVKTQTIKKTFFKINIVHNLWIKDGLDTQEADKIKQGFMDYKFSEIQNPDQFAADLGVDPGSFVASAHYSLTRDYDEFETAHDDEIRHYYVSSEIYSLIEKSSTVVPGVNEIDAGGVVVDDADDPSSQEGELLEEYTHSTKCEAGGFTYKSHKIATLLKYPEFKIVWRRRRIKIGCVRIVIHLPVLQTRTAKRVLWAFIAHSSDFGVYVEKMMERCLLEAAVGGSIIGLATGNLAVAKAAFNALLTECIKRHVGEYIKCWFPDLKILKETNGWSDV